MTGKDTQDLAEIDETMGLANAGTGNAVISRESVMRWMESDDIEALGAVSVLIFDRQFYPGIEPPLTFEDYHPFMMRYCERWIREDPDGEWSDSRYSAGHDLVNWFGWLWKDKSVPRSALEELRDWLGRLYKDGDEEIRECLVTAIFEHLFEDLEIRGFFADWKADPVMEPAYRDALDYANWAREQWKKG